MVSADKEIYQRANDKAKTDSENMFEIAELMFDQGKSIIIAIGGNIMYPFIRREVDRAEVFRVATRDIRVSDIVLIRHRGGHMIRRVHKIENDDFYLIGDAEAVPSGPYNKSVIAGKVTVIIRNGKRVICSSAAMRPLVFVWRVLRPLRPMMIYIYRKIRSARMKRKRKTKNNVQVRYN